MKRLQSVELQRSVKLDYSDTYLENEALETELDGRISGLQKAKYKAGIDRDENLERARKEAEEIQKLSDAVKKQSRRDDYLLQSKSAKESSRFDRIMDNSNVKSESSVRDTDDRESNVSDDESTEGSRLKPVNIAMFKLNIKNFRRKMSEAKVLNRSNDINIMRDFNIYGRKSQSAPISFSGTRRRPDVPPPRFLRPRAKPRKTKEGEVLEAMDVQPIFIPGVHMRKPHNSRSRRQLQEISKIQQEEKFGKPDRKSEERKKVEAWAKVIICIGAQSNSREGVVSPPLPSNLDIVNPTFPAPPAPKCDIVNSVSCLKSLSRAQQAAANQNQQDSAQAVDSLCRSMDAAFLCIGDKLNGCTGKYQLLYSTAVSAGRFLCNGNGRQGFVENYQCLFSEKFKNSSNGCSTNVVTGIVDYVMRSTVTTSGSSDPEEMCRMGRDVSMCIIKTSMKACGENSVTFLKDYLSAAMSPLRQMLACESPAGFIDTPPQPIELITSAPETSTAEQPATTTTPPPTTTTPAATTSPSTTTQVTTTTTRKATTSPEAAVQPVATQAVLTLNTVRQPVATRPVSTRRLVRQPVVSAARRQPRRCDSCVANRRAVPASYYRLYDLICATNFINSRSRYCPQSVCVRTRPCPRILCYAVGALRDLDNSDSWCQKQCTGGDCPASVQSLCNCVLINEL